MCVASMVGDHYRDGWGDPTKVWPYRVYPNDETWPLEPRDKTIPVSPISRQEFDKLKEEVAELVKLLKRAKKYDEDNGEPHCEIEDKMAFLRKVAKLVGVDLDKELGPIITNTVKTATARGVL